MAMPESANTHPSGSIAEAFVNLGLKGNRPDGGVNSPQQARDAGRPEAGEKRRTRIAPPVIIRR
jgi:hypothetical protein